MTEQEANKEAAINDHQQRINALKKAKKSAQSASVAVAYKTDIARLKNEIAQLKIGMQP